MHLRSRHLITAGEIGGSFGGTTAEAQSERGCPVLGVMAIRPPRMNGMIETIGTSKPDALGPKATHGREFGQ
eukprot:m.221596 g.221596  ORF g.221596 m.221596 type:complete len:72 (+) comp15616_c0_seq4:865-1080(+)